MELRLEKDFMFIRVRLLVVILVLGSCEPQMSDDPIPWVSFPDVVMNLSFPENIALRTDGGIREINDAGVRGIIVYRVNGTNFRAYERNCSFSPNAAGSTVNLHHSNLYFVDDSCGSSFTLDEGTPMGGPAWRPLRQYRATVSNNILTVTEEVIN